MKYQGGKSRIANDIAQVIMGCGQNKDTFISLFCGACSVETKINGFKKMVCNDSHPYLIALFKALQDGYELPDVITQEDWYYLKEHKDENPALSGFAGFACSFGGRWFQGYARDKQGTNYALRGKNSLIKKMQNLMYVEFTCLDYRDVKIPDNCIIYADPPYENTKQYVGMDFNHEDFWQYAKDVSKNHIMFISSLNAPENFISIWEKDVRRTLDVNKNNQFKSTEKLFVHKNNIEIIQNNTCNIL